MLEKDGAYCRGETPERKREGNKQIYKERDYFGNRRADGDQESD